MSGAWRIDTSLNPCLQGITACKVVIIAEQSETQSMGEFFSLETVLYIIAKTMLESI
jgi:hypothetical protein